MSLPTSRLLCAGLIIALLISCSASNQNKKIDLGDATESTRPIKVVDADFRESVLRLASEDNQCPEGFSMLNGTWAFKGQTQLQGFRNRLVFREASFTEFLFAKGQEVDEKGIIQGHYACIDGGRLVFSIDSVEPKEGVFGNYSKTDYVCTLLWNMQAMGKNMALICHVDWDPARTLDFVYARSGL